MLFLNSLDLFQQLIITDNFISLTFISTLLDLFSQLSFNIIYFVTVVLLILFNLYDHILNARDTVCRLLLNFLYSLLHIVFASSYAPWILHLGLDCFLHQLLFSLLAQQQTLVNVVIHLVSENFKLFLICFVVVGGCYIWCWWFAGCWLSKFILIIWHHWLSSGAIIRKLFLSILRMWEWTILCSCQARVKIVSSILCLKLVDLECDPLQLVSSFGYRSVHLYLLYSLTDTILFDSYWLNTRSSTKFNIIYFHLHFFI